MDALFWYHDIALNTDLTPALGGYLKVAGEVMKIAKVDDHSYSLSASQPFDYARPRSAIWYYANVFPMNYLKDFHPAHTDAGKLDSTAKEAGLRHLDAVVSRSRRPSSGTQPRLPHDHAVEDPESRPGDTRRLY